MKEKLNSLREIPRKSLNKNKNLQKAKSAKKDEFYTQLTDIEKELKHYKDQFRGKIVYCNCDDPYESNFFKYFVLNFQYLGLKKLITTSHIKSPIVGLQLKTFEVEGIKTSNKKPFKIEIIGIPDSNKDGAIDLNDVKHLLKHDKNTVSPLKGNGDFRSEECVELLKQADIVVTNPPFSLFREYIAQLMEYKKKFLILGNVNAITYKEIFPKIKENKLWFGPSISSGDREFQVPDDYSMTAIGQRIDKEGKKYLRIKGVRWFTNLDTTKRHEKITLYKKYSPKEYPKYDNYNAINIDKVSDIPKDYNGVMGVPITFLDKFNPEQFKIVGEMVTTKVDKFNYGYPFINGKKIYARILIKRKKQHENEN